MGSGTGLAAPQKSRALAGCLQGMSGDGGWEKCAARAHFPVAPRVTESLYMVPQTPPTRLCVCTGTFFQAIIPNTVSTLSRLVLGLKLWQKLQTQRLDNYPWAADTRPLSEGQGQHNSCQGEI